MKLCKHMMTLVLYDVELAMTLGSLFFVLRGLVNCLIHFG